jgi:hypothetical protein
MYSSAPPGPDEFLVRGAEIIACEAAAHRPNSA